LVNNLIKLLICKDIYLGAKDEQTINHGSN